MDTIANHITNWSKTRQVHMDQRDNRLFFAVTGKNGSFSTASIAIEEEQLFIFVCGLQEMVPEQKRDGVALALMDLNYGLKWGQFQIYRTTGEITLRNVQYVPKDYESGKTVVEGNIELTVQTMDYFLPVLRGLFKEE